MAASPTQRTLAACRKRGLFACVVEKWIPQTKQRKDAFGFGDVLVIGPTSGATLIQATDATNASKRCIKIAEQCTDAAAAWLDAGNEILVWGWRKKPNGRWTCNEYRFRVEAGAVVYERTDACLQ